MALTDPTAPAVFWDIHCGLPREGPGNRESTARALGLAAPIPRNAQVLDIACGPGMQTLDLAELLPDASICAVDGHEPFVAETNRRAASRGMTDRVRATRADMRSLEFQPATFDLIWCEGAGDTAAESILRESAEEIISYRKYAQYYGYAFLVMMANDGVGMAA